MSNAQPQYTSEDFVNAFLARVRNDAELRERILNDREALLRETGIEPAAIEGAKALLVGEGDGQSIVFVRESSGAATEAFAPPEYQWPYRTYRLVNNADRTLNLETWRDLVPPVRYQELAQRVDPRTYYEIGVATYAELIANKCNLHNNSYLARDLTNGKVLKESYNITCGDVRNWLTASGSGDNITVVESHP
jgi:hypothetical protein